MKDTIQSAMLAAVKQLDLEEALQFELRRFRDEHPEQVVGFRVTVSCLDTPLVRADTGKCPERGRLVVEAFQSETGGTSGRAVEILARGMVLEAKVGKLLGWIQSPAAGES